MDNNKIVTIEVLEYFYSKLVELFNEKAGQTDLESLISSVTESMNSKADAATVNEALETLAATVSRKADASALTNKVDKVSGKGLSTNDYTTAEKNAVATIASKADASALTNKVDKVSGKGLSTNDYTTAEKNVVATIKNKVDKVSGKGLSTNDYTTSEKEAVATIASKANSSDVTAALAQKANISTLSNGIIYKGSKATLSEIQAITPTISSGAPTHQYYCTATSHYYTWNGSSWDDTGTMNSAASEVETARAGRSTLSARLDETDSDLGGKQGANNEMYETYKDEINSIQKCLKFVGHNLLNPAVSYSSRLEWNGTETADQGLTTTDYIYVSGYPKIITKSKSGNMELVWRICAYDKEHNFTHGTDHWVNTLALAANDAYVRIVYNSPKSNIKLGEHMVTWSEEYEFETYAEKPYEYSTVSYDKIADIPNPIFSKDRIVTFGSSSFHFDGDVIEVNCNSSNSGIQVPVTSVTGVCKIKCSGNLNGTGALIILIIQGAKINVIRTVKDVVFDEEIIFNTESLNVESPFSVGFASTAKNDTISINELGVFDLNETAKLDIYGNDLGDTVKNINNAISGELVYQSLISGATTFGRSTVSLSDGEISVDCAAAMTGVQFGFVPSKNCLNVSIAGTATGTVNVVLSMFKSDGESVFYDIGRVLTNEFDDTFQFDFSKVVEKLENYSYSIAIISPTEGKNITLSKVDISFEIQKKYAGYTKYASKKYNSSYSVPVLYLDGDFAGMSKEISNELEYKFKNMSGSCTVKWQGSSSINYDKKNFTIKFDTKFEAVSGWGESKKYVLKANYIDFTHSRNICGAKLWGQIVKSRSSTPEKLKTLVNGGAIDGFPISLVVNGMFYGLYTFNIPKDDIMFKMQGTGTECIISSEIDTSNQTKFKATTTTENVESEADFGLEYIENDEDLPIFVSSLNTAITAAMNATGSGFESQIRNYIDIDSFIDYYIFSCLTGNLDGVAKNYLLATFDGTKWFISAYDLDSIFGNNWTGRSYVSSKTASPTFAGYKNTNRVMELIYKYDKQKLVQRYKELRNGILSEANVLDVFCNYMVKIPKELSNKDIETWGDLPGTGLDGLAQITAWYKNRCEYMDAEIDALL